MRLRRVSRTWGDGRRREACVVVVRGLEVR